MSGAISAVKARLLERKEKVKQQVASVIPSLVPRSSTSVVGSSETVSSERTEKKKDRQNALGVKDERTDYEKAPDSTEPEAKRRKMEEKAEVDMSLEDMLSASSAKEKESKKISKEIMDLLNRPTTKDKQLQQKFKSDGRSMQEFCARGTRQECARTLGKEKSCEKLHFKKIIQRHTDLSLGDCSFLNTCFHMDTCKYIHYEVDYSTVKERQQQQHNSSATAPVAQGKEADERNSVGESNSSQTGLKQRNSSGGSLKSGSGKEVGKYAETIPQKSGLMDKTKLSPPQWIQCDLRFLDFSILGKFSVIMADPPWDIHMELPYGTMADEEMRRLPVQSLQDHGFFFLWVTGRAMELGRECLRLWGYKQIDELIWVKTNQLQRIIRTGRTGHWLNHGKEHCLVGLKGNPHNAHRGLDCDIIVGEVRATSHKPDEIYGIIERLSPGTRKIELFGRAHNVQPNWITLGNQLDGVRLIEPEVVEKFNERYPDGNCLPKPEEVILYKQKQQQKQNKMGGKKM